MATEQDSVDAKRRHYKGFIAGVFSGIAKLTVGHPFDTLKVRLQTSASSAFRGPIDCLSKTVSREGVTALYKGATPPLIGWMFMDSVMLGSLSFYRHVMADYVFVRPLYSAKSDSMKGRTEPHLPTIGHSLAGVMSGATVSFVAAPVEHIKARLQIQYAADKSMRRYQGPVDCLAKIYRSHGIPGVYHGLGATLIFRSFFFFWWGSYDIFTRMLNEHTNLSKAAVNFWAGGLSAQVFWTVAYPSDVIKQRIMTDPLGGTLNDGQPRFARWRDALFHVRKIDGFRGFWRGFVPCFIRAFPANAMALVAFEAVMRTLPE